MADVRDEHGNPIQLTDERGNPVELTDEFGNPMHLTGVATAASKLESTGGDVGQTQLVPEPQPDRAGSPRRATSSSSSSSEDDGQGGRRRKKKGFTQKIKEKLTGSGKHKAEAAPAAAGAGAGRHQGTTVEAKTTSTVDFEHHQDQEKKGVMEKIREKLPGHHH